MCMCIVYVCMFTCVGAHMYAGVYVFVHVCMCMCAGQRVALAVFFYPSALGIWISLTQSS